MYMYVYTSWIGYELHPDHTHHYVEMVDSVPCHLPRHTPLYYSLLPKEILVQCIYMYMYVNLVLDSLTR